MSPRPFSSQIWRTLETTAIAAVGGAALGLPGFPAGWLSGAFLAVMVFAVAGRPLSIPDPAARVVFVLLGIILGSAVTPATVMRLAAWPFSLVLLTFAMAVITIAVAGYLKLVHGWDNLSALFASAPGALSQALAMAAQTGADVRSVAMVQAVRIVVFVVVLPLLMGHAEISGAAPGLQRGSALAAHPSELAALVVICALVATLAQRFRMPGGLIVGAMTASGILHGSGLISAAMPPGIAIACFVALGAVIGARFVGVDVRMLGRLAGPALGALALGSVLALGFALLAANLLSLRTAEVFLAYVPGGLEAMSILAFALNLDPVFVSAHHLARYVFLSMALPAAAAWAKRSGSVR